MDRFNALSRGTQLMLVGAALLLIDTLLPWQRIEEIGFSASAWNGFWGVMLGLLTIALLAWLVVRLLGTELRLPVSDALVGAALGSLILLFAVIKILTDDFVSYGAWIGLVLAIVIALGAWLQVQAAGGVDTLRSEVSTVGSSAESSGSQPGSPHPGGAGEPVAPSTPRPPAASPSAPASPAAPMPPTPSEGTAPATEQPPATTQPPPPPPETRPSEDEPRP